MWNAIVDWLWHPSGRAAIVTVAAVVLAAVVYLLLRRRIRAPHRLAAGTVKTYLRLAGLCVVLLLAFVVLWTWLGPSPESGVWHIDPEMHNLLRRILWTLGIAAAAYVSTTAVQQALLRSTMEIESRHRIRLATTWFGVGALLIALAIVWLSGIANLGVFLGIFGAGLALSMQETVLCIVGWLLLVFRRPYDIGDRIEIGNAKGDVIGVGVMQTSMLEVGNWVGGDQSTGRMLIIPNSMLLRGPVYNYSKGFPFVWDEINLVVTFESDWEAARDLMLDKAEVEAEKIESQVKAQIAVMQSRYAIRYQQLTPIVYTSIADNGVKLTLRYLCPVRERRAITHRISQNLLRAILGHPQVELAYPTTRLFRNTEEGKLRG